MSSLVDFPCSLPFVTIPEDTNAAEVAASFASHLDNLGTDHFSEDAIWRDVFALTGTLRTFYSASSASAAWRETSKRARIESFVLDETSPQVIRLPNGVAFVQAMFVFKTNATPQSTSSMILQLVPSEDGLWKIWVMRTILEQLNEASNVDVLAPEPQGAKTNSNHETSHFDCVIIGAGLAGLSTAGRLKALGISYVVLDKYENVGDNWKMRYDGARLHTTREYGHPPFERTFGPEYDKYLSKDDLARGYRSWATKYGIKLYLHTTLSSGSWDESQNLWTLNIKHGNENERAITCSNVVVAAGSGGQEPKMPHYLNEECFRGTSMHSAEFTNASKWKRKHGVVVGTANTAHDVAEDMLASGLSSVTMIQRSKTYILPAEYYKKISDLNYNATKPIEEADRMTQTSPFAIADLMSQAALHAMAQQEPERFDALERVGFKTERYGNIQHCILVRQGGHYMDVGASEKIARGLIKVKSDALPIGYIADGLKFSDGSELKADVVVFATGFQANMKCVVKTIFGPSIAEKVGDFWDLDKEGELKGAFKPLGHPAIWMHGGTIGQARFFSRFIALQIKARLMGTPLPQYQKTP